MPQVALDLLASSSMYRDLLVSYENRQSSNKSASSRNVFSHSVSSFVAQGCYSVFIYFSQLAFIIVRPTQDFQAFLQRFLHESPVRFHPMFTKFDRTSKSSVFRRRRLLCSHTIQA